MKRQVYSFIASLFMVLLLLNAVIAAPIDLYTVSFTVDQDESVAVEQKFEFLEPVSQEMSIALPPDAEKLYLFVDGVLVKPELADSKLSVVLKDKKEAVVTYKTKQLTDDNNLIVSLNMPYDVNDLTVKVTLKEGITLAKKISKDEVASSAVYPYPKLLTTDGQDIIIGWNEKGIAKGQEAAYLVRYKESGFPWFIVLLIAVIIGLIIFIIFKKPRVEVITKKEIVKEIVEKGTNIEEHLKEDEAQVVNILKQRESQCEQGTLRVITGFSKAKLSGLLKELEDRNVIHKEKRGKKNLVFLRKQ